MRRFFRALYTSFSQKPASFEIRSTSLPGSSGLQVESLEERVVLSANSIAFIDPAIYNNAAVSAEIASYVDEVVVLDSTTDGVQQIADYLSDRSEVGAIHLITHGDSGEILNVGSVSLNASNLSNYTTQLTSIGNALTEDGDILLWGCEVADASGSQFVDDFATLTGADVAASTDLTASAALGGDWDLEYTTGTIEAENILAQLDADVALSHFRFGTISWEIVNPATRTVRFTIEQSWRSSRFNDPAVGTTLTEATSSFRFGDGDAAPVYLTVTNVDANNDLFFGRATFEHSYDSNSIYTVGWDDCCRISSLLHNQGSDPYRVEADIDLRGDLNTPNLPPTSTISPIVQVVADRYFQFQIPATDPNGDALTYRIASTAESGLNPYAPPGLTVSSSGLIEWDVSSPNAVLPGEMWAVQVIVSDGGNEVPLDFILQVVAKTSELPTVEVTPAGPFTPAAGQTITFDVTATDADGTIASLTALNAPDGMTLSAPVVVGNTMTRTVTWTPTEEQSGTTMLITFQAVDNEGGQGTYAVEITPGANLAPVATIHHDTSMPTPYGGGFEVYEGSTLLLTSSATDPEGDALTYEWDLDYDGTFNVARGGTGQNFLFDATHHDGTHHHDIALRVTDEAGNVSYAFSRLFVVNVFPVLTVEPGDVVIKEGDTATKTISTFDIPKDPVSVNASHGTLTNHGGGNWTWSYEGTDDLTTTVTIHANDGDGGNAYHSFDLTVDNVDPTISVDQSAVVIYEGNSASKPITTADVSADTVTVTASHGTVTDNGNGNWTWNYDGTDDLATTTVTLTAEDEDGGLTSKTFDLTVNNAAPADVVINSVSGIFEDGETLAFGAGTASDPAGANDTLTYTWDFGDGSGSVTGQNATHTYQAGGEFTVTLTVSDEEGGSTSISRKVTIQKIYRYTEDISAYSLEFNSADGSVTVLNSDGTPAESILPASQDEQLIIAEFAGVRYNVVLGTNADETLQGTDDDVSLEGCFEENVLSTRVFATAGRDLMFGGDGADELYGGNALDYLFGGEGNDYLEGQAGLSYAYGGAGDDEIVGDDEVDVAFGGQGNDVITGFGGDDHLLGDSGEDTLDGGTGDDRLDGGYDNDTITDIAGANTIHGGRGDDTITGGSDADQIWGDQGDDTIVAGAGDDKIYGGEGGDRIEGNEGDDYIVAGNGGYNFVYGGSGNDLIFGGDQGNLIYGGDGSDRIVGHDGVDSLYGEAGNDYLWGLGGNDWLRGGDGNDYLMGGDGSDMIYAGKGRDYVWGQDGYDYVYANRCEGDQVYSSEYIIWSASCSSGSWWSSSWC